MDNVPDQPIDPPEPRRYVTWDEYLEHEQDRLIDEAKENDTRRDSGLPPNKD